MLSGLILSTVVGLTPQLAPATPAAPSVPQLADRAFSRLFQPSTPAGTGEEGTAQDLETPYRQLIVPNGPREKKPGPRSKIVCGMTLLFVGPEVDPKMPKTPSQDGVHYTIRRYPPPACGKK